MNHIPFDLGDSLRARWCDLGYTVTAVVTLAPTIGAATATFSVVNGVRLNFKTLSITIRRGDVIASTRG